jgi:hypothetical protein
MSQANLSSRDRGDSNGQITLGDMRGGQLAAELDKLDADTLTPLEALALIYKWKREAGTGP